MPNKIYISGPMRGYPQLNFPAFDACRAALLQQGWPEDRIVSPADMDRAMGFDPTTGMPEEGEFSFESAIRRDLRVISEECQAMVFLPGWEKSEGAKIEYAAAKACGCQFFNWFPGYYGGVSVSSKVLDNALQYAETSSNSSRANKGLPLEASARKGFPVATGVVDYFPDALVAVAEVSRKGNDQHNPGKPLFWDRSKSGDEADALMRHFIERGKLDSDGVRHSAKVAWRALALLQKEIENDAKGTSGPQEQGRQDFLQAN